MGSFFQDRFCVRLDSAGLLRLSTANKSFVEMLWTLN